MKRVVKVRLMPSPEQAAALTATLAACNAAATYAADVAHTRAIFRGYDLRAVTYGDVRARFGLPAQLAQNAIRKTVDAYTTRRANCRAGNYGPAGAARRVRVESTPIRFKPWAAHPFDDRCLRWDHDAATVSITTVNGRLKDVPFTGHPDHLAVIAAHRKGESDLSRDRDGRWFLTATIDLPTSPVTPPHAGFIGVDMGIVTIAAATHVTATGTPDGDSRDWSGGAVTARRKKNAALRRTLQSKGTKSAKRLLRKRSRKETRMMADVNHQISKTIVAEAKRTGRGIAVENLTGIRDRVRHRKPQRATMNSWAFAQLGQYLRYKAEAAGVAFIEVDPRNTSRECHRCHFTDKRNRPTQAVFQCGSCHVSLNADTNASIVIGQRAVTRWWGAVNHPDAA